MIVKAKNIKGFYQIDNTILQFDPIKDVLKLQFNHMIMQKENLSRLTTELDKGQFYLSLHDIMIRLNITINKARKLIKDFIELGIIDVVKKGKSKNDLSIYKYNSVTEVVAVADEDPDDSEDPVNFDANENEKLDIFGNERVEEDSLIDFDFTKGDVIEKIDLIGSYGYKTDVSDVHILGMIQNSTWEDLERALKISAVKGGKSLKYVLTVCLNNEYNKKNNTYKTPKINNNKKPSNMPVVSDDVSKAVEKKEQKQIEEVQNGSGEMGVMTLLGKSSYEKMLKGDPVLSHMVDRALYYAKVNNLDVELVQNYKNIV